MAKNIIAQKIETGQRLRKILLDFGYKYIVLCDFHDYGAISTNFYRLLKEEKDIETFGCFNFSISPLESDEALQFLADYLESNIISPDISSIDIDSDQNEDPIIKEQQLQKLSSSKFQANKIYYNRVKEMRIRLLDQGYKSLDYCEEIDDGTVITKEYILSKGDEIAKPDRCTMQNSFPLESEEATQILKQWVNQISIYPDPRTL
jgi:hypothetical protein